MLGSLPGFEIFNEVFAKFTEITSESLTDMPLGDTNGEQNGCYSSWGFNYSNDKLIAWTVF